MLIESCKGRSGQMIDIQTDKRRERKKSVNQEIRAILIFTVIQYVLFHDNVIIL